MRMVKFSALVLALGLITLAGCGQAEPGAHKFSVIIGGDAPAKLAEDVAEPGGALVVQPVSTFRDLRPQVVVEPIPKVEDMTLSRTVERSLTLMGGAGVPELRQALSDSRMNVRIKAASILAKIGPDAKEAIPDLMRCMQDPNPDLKKAAIRALGAIGPDASEAAPTLVRLLDAEI